MQILKALHELHSICENKPMKKPVIHNPDFQVKFTNSPFDSSIPTLAEFKSGIEAGLKLCLSWVVTYG